MIVSDFNRFGGKHTEIAALRNVLDYLGISAPHTRQPYTEELLFGIGGGIGFAYFLFESSGNHTVRLGTRVHTRETERPEFFLNIASRIGVQLRIQNSSSNSAAEVNLRRSLQRGRTPIVSVDPIRLPYLGLSMPVHTYYCVVVYGIDEDTDRVLLSGRPKHALSITREELRASRETSWSPRYRSVLVEPQAAEVDIQAAVRDGIRNCCHQMNHGLGVANFGVRGIEKWATMLTSYKERKSWPKIFSRGASLYNALYSIFAQISGRSDTGNANRLFYAAFLDEAADILSNPGLRRAAENYRGCDRIWRDVAEAHLPDSVPLFHEAKQLTLGSRVLFESEGAEAAGQIRRIHSRLEAIAHEAAVNFPLSFEDSRALLSDLRGQVLRLRDSEADALRSLEGAMGSCNPETERNTRFQQGEELLSSVAKG